MGFAQNFSHISSLTSASLLSGVKIDRIGMIFVTKTKGFRIANGACRIFIAVITSTCEGPISIGTFSIGVAIISFLKKYISLKCHHSMIKLTFKTFVNISAVESVSFVTFVTSTVVTSDGVCAESMDMTVRNISYKVWWSHCSHLTE